MGEEDRQQEERKGQIRRRKEELELVGERTYKRNVCRLN